MKKRLLTRRPDPTMGAAPEEYPRLLGADVDLPEVEYDPARALRQWESYVEVFAKAGWDIVELPDTPSVVTSCFIEDSAVTYRTVALMTRGAVRHNETDSAIVREQLETLGYAIANTPPKAYIGGGDVQYLMGTVHVGRGQETNAQGVAAVRRLFTALDLRVVAVPLRGAPYLRKAATLLPDGATIGNPDLLLDTRVFDRFLPAPEPAGASVVALSPDEVVVSASASGTAALLQNLGFKVTAVDISEFEKLDGCITSLSMRLWDRV